MNSKEKMQKRFVAKENEIKTTKKTDQNLLIIVWKFRVLFKYSVEFKKKRVSIIVDKIIFMHLLTSFFFSVKHNILKKVTELIDFINRNVIKWRKRIGTR